MATELDEFLAQIQAWRSAGKGVALATVVETWGSSPRPVGSHLAADETGAFVGSVSGGCIEGAVIGEAKEIIAGGKPRLLEFGVSDERAWEVGLSCGGRVRVHVERVDSVWVEQVLSALRERRSLAVVTRLSDASHASYDGARANGALALDDATGAEVRRLLLSGASATLQSAPGLFARSYVTAPRLLVIGAVHITQALAPMAALTGFDVAVIDPRQVFASAERFPGVTVLDEWPDDALARLGIDARTAIVTLSHDPKLDDPALSAALRSPAFYVGSLGSTRTHAKRVARLTEAGLGEAVGRIHTPVGLDLGGRSPSEIAVSILAQIIQVRYR